MSEESGLDLSIIGENESNIDENVEEQAEEERLAAEAAAKAEEERLAAEATAKAEEERLATEAAAKAEEERLAAEAAAKAEEERLAAEAAAEAAAKAEEVAAKAVEERLKKENSNVIIANESLNELYTLSHLDVLKNGGVIYNEDVEYISKFLTPEQNNLLNSQTKNTARNRILRDLIDPYKMQIKQ
jgi:leucyl-tRNA synthetase